MSRTFYEEELKKLKIDLIQMAGVTETMIDDGICALNNADLELASEVVKRDKDVDNLESSIEKQCLHLFLKQQPVAKDFRVISAILKMITDIERIGDQAADICEIVVSIRKPYIKKPIHLMAMAKAAQQMVNESVLSFINEDLKLARDTIERDNEVDNLFEVIKGELIELIRADSSNADQAILFMMIAKYLERIADHATNICEWVIYSITGDKPAQEGANHV